MKRLGYLALIVVVIASMSTFTEAAKKRGGGGSGSTPALTDAETAGLLAMREEEKLARDVYLTLGEKWNQLIFDNIAASEQRHMDAVKNLLDKYGLADPAAGNGIGEFTDPVFTELFDQLVAQGNQSVEEAYKVGVAIEELDIDDLKILIAETTKSDIKRVYTNLLNGSYNHLAAFSSMLD